MIIKKGIIDAPTIGRDYIAKIGLVSDIHVGYDIWNRQSLYDCFKNVANKNCDFVVSLGDEIDSGYKYTPELMVTQLEQLNEGLQALNRPIFKIKGNHDVDVNSFTEFGSVLFNNIKFISIFPKYVGMTVPEGENSDVWSNGMLTESDIEYIRKELENLNGAIPIIFSHYCIHLPSKEDRGKFNWNICDIVDGTTSPATNNGLTKDGHRRDLIALCKQYDVPLFVNGHEHKPNLHSGKVDDLNMTNVQIGSFTSVFVTLTIYHDRFEFVEYNSVTGAENGYTLTVNY